MKYYTNDYESLLYVFNLKKYDAASVENHYAECYKSKNDTISYLKNKIISNTDFSEEYKDCIRLDKNVSIFCFYVTRFDVSCDIYRDEYEEYDNGYVPDAFGGYYKEYLTRFLGRLKTKTLLDVGETSEHKILKPDNKDFNGKRDNDYNIVCSTFTLYRLYEDMIKSEKILWENNQWRQWDEIKNEKYQFWHTPFIVLKCKFNGQEFVSWINSSTLGVYLAGYYSNAKLFKQIYDDAKNGDPKKMYTLGNECYIGKYSTPNPKEAIKWLTLSADKGYVKAAELIGVLYYGREEKGFVEDQEKAFKYTKLAADGDSGISNCNLGIYYEYGIGTTTNLKYAMMRYCRAAKLGYKKADEKIDKLAQSTTNPNIINDAGEHYEKVCDYKKALKYYEDAANKYNHPEAMYNLSRCYDDYTGPFSFVYNHDKSLELYQKALELGSNGALKRSKELELEKTKKLTENKQKKHSEEAIQLYLKAKENKTLTSEMSYILAQHYESGIFVEQDLVEAFSLYANCYSINKGFKELKYYAKKNYLPAQYYLGKYYQNLAKYEYANKEFFKAAEAGYKIAIEELSKMVNDVSLSTDKSQKNSLEFLKTLAEMRYEEALYSLINYYSNCGNEKLEKKYDKLYDKLYIKNKFRKHMLKYDPKAITFKKRLRINRYKPKKEAKKEK